MRVAVLIWGMVLARHFDINISAVDIVALIIWGMWAMMQDIGEIKKLWK